MMITCLFPTQSISQNSYEYQGAVADVRSFLLQTSYEWPLQVAYFHSAAFKSLDDPALLEIVQAYFDEYGHEMPLYAVQDPMRIFRLVLGFGEVCNFRTAPFMYSYGPITCQDLQIPEYVNESLLAEFLSDPQPGFEFNALLQLSVNENAVDYEMIAGTLFDRNDISDLIVSDYVILTSLGVVDSLANGITISDSSSYATVSITSSGSRLEEFLCGEALLNTSYWNEFVLNNISPLGFDGRINAVQTNCLKNTWGNRPLDDVIFVSRPFLESNAVPDGYTAVGEVTAISLIEFYNNELNVAKVNAHEAANRRANEAGNSSEGSYSALLLFLPEPQNRDVVDLGVCFLNEDEQLAREYISNVRSYFEEYFSLWELGDKFAVETTSFSLNGNVLFDNYDSVYQMVQSELNYGSRPRECDVLFGQSSVINEIRVRTSNLLFQSGLWDYPNLIHRLVLGEAVDGQELLQNFLSTEGYRTKEDADFGAELGVADARAVYALYEIGISNRSEFDQMVDELYEILGREVRLEDIGNFVSLALEAGSYEAAMDYTRDNVEEQLRQMQAQREAQARDYPFYALLTCNYGGSTVALAACFVGDVETTVSVSTLNLSREVNYFNFNAIGRLINNQSGLRIDLPPTYNLSAQNASDTLSLLLEIRRTVDDQVVYSQDQGRMFGIVAHRQ